MIDSASAARRHLELQIIEKDLIRQYWRDNRVARQRDEARNESEIPARPLGIPDTDWWDYCAGVRARGRTRARYADDYDVWASGLSAPFTEAILRVEQALRLEEERAAKRAADEEEAEREQRSAERLAERAREHARAEIERAAAIATARRQARAELAELAAAAAVERARREEAAAAWRAAPSRPGSFGGALRAARSAMRISADDRERVAYAALVESARRHGCGWPSRGHDREALHAIERVASRSSVAASAWRVVHTAAKHAIRQRWEQYDGGPS